MTHGTGYLPDSARASFRYERAIPNNVVESIKDDIDSAVEDGRDEAFDNVRSELILGGKNP